MLHFFLCTYKYVWNITERITIEFIVLYLKQLLSSFLLHNSWNGYFLTYQKREYTVSLSIFLLLRHFRNATRHKDNIKYKTGTKNFLALEQHPFNNFAYIACTLSHSWHYSKQAHVHKTMYAIDHNRVKAKQNKSCQKTTKFAERQPNLNGNI